MNISPYLDHHRELLEFSTPKVSSQTLSLPRPTQIEEVFTISDRSPRVVKNLKRMFSAGRLANTGYINILPVDQGLEHTGGFSFYHEPSFFDPSMIVKLAIDGGCSAVASTLGVLGLVADEFAGDIPFIVKLNHNELLTYPTEHNQILFGQVEQAAQLGAVGIGATIYFGSPESKRQIQEVSQAFALAHELGLFTILWCYPRNPGFTKDGVNYESAADITGQACHIGVTIQADIIKQKSPSVMDGFRQIGFSKFSDAMYEALLSDHPIDMTRYQVLNCYAGKIGLINSGGGSVKPQDGQSRLEADVSAAVRTAIINKRAGGIGLISGRKAFTRPLSEGVQVLNAIQDVYLSDKVTVA